MAEIGRERYLRSSAVVSREIADETLVVPIRGGAGDLDSIFSFNPLGSELWGLMENEVSVEEMTSWITEHYEVSQQQALGDIREFVGELLGAGLVTSIAAPPVSTGELESVHASSGI
jgi:coenzyme PQQ synthesis protein D (PqqD)